MIRVNNKQYKVEINKTKVKLTHDENIYIITDIVKTDICFNMKSVVSDATLETVYVDEIAEVITEGEEIEETPKEATNPKPILKNDVVDFSEMSSAIEEESKRINEKIVEEKKPIQHTKTHKYKQPGLPMSEVTLEEGLNKEDVEALTMLLEYGMSKLKAALNKFKRF